MKKYIAPIIVAAIVLLYLVAYTLLIAFIPIHIALKIAILIIPIAFCGVTIYVLVQRINEIRKGEDDDLSKY